jgi:hypothetical protein
MSGMSAMTRHGMSTLRSPMTHFELAEDLFPDIDDLR